MVVPFGFSVGDFITGTKLLIATINGFKEAGGASEKHASETAFLNSLISTLQHLDAYTKKAPQSEIAVNISSLLDTIRDPLSSFKDFLDEHKASLDKASTKSSIRKTAKIISYTLKDISGKVEKLRRQVEQPLQVITTLLSLQAM
jgi:hypothetical protein